MDQLSRERRTPPSRGPRHMLARAGALTLSLGIVALLMIQAGLPGCFAADPPIQPEPRSADTPPAPAAPAAPAAPGAVANDPAAAAPASPMGTPGVASPAPEEEAASKGKPSTYFPATKSGGFPIDREPPQSQAPSPPPQQAKPQGKP